MLTRNSLIGLLVSQGVAALIGLLVAFGVALTPEQMAAIMSAAGFLGIVLALVLWASTVDRREVVERLIGSDVVAGEANDMIPSGEVVRELEPRRAKGDLP